MRVEVAHVPEDLVFRLTSQRRWLWRRLGGASNVGALALAREVVLWLWWWDEFVLLPLRLLTAIADHDLPWPFLLYSHLEVGLRSLRLICLLQILHLRQVDSGLVNGRHSICLPLLEVQEWVQAFGAAHVDDWGCPLVVADALFAWLDRLQVEVYRLRCLVDLRIPCADWLGFRLLGPQLAWIVVA